jgi:hypothetical protein
VAVMEPLPVLQVAAIDSGDPEQNWLVRSLWGRAAGGFVGGAPKTCKSWLALDFAVSVASGTAALGRFAVDAPGPALVYLAEDHLAAVRQRVASLCEHRGLNLG